MLDELIKKLNAEILKKFPTASKQALIRRLIPRDKSGQGPQGDCQEAGL